MAGCCWEHPSDGSETDTVRENCDEGKSVHLGPEPQVHPLHLPVSGLEGRQMSGFLLHPV